MDLQFGSLPWKSTLPSRHVHPPLSESIHCDVLVVGSGISGALCAYELCKRGFDVVVLEKRHVGGGSTSSNTGLLQYMNDRSLTSCIGLFGERKGVRFYTLCKQAAERLLTIAFELDKDSEMFPRNSLYYASSEEDVRSLRAEYDTLHRYGFHTEWWDSEQIRHRFRFDKPAAIVTHGDAEVNPYRFTHALLHTAKNKYKLRIYEHTKVIQVGHEGGIIQIQTDSGYVATAKHAVFALGYETNEMKPNPNTRITSSFAIKTQTIPNLQDVWHERFLIWETRRPYLYLRTSADNRILAGGLDEGDVSTEERNKLLPSKTAQLIKEVEALFPQLAPLIAEHAWAGAFGVTQDGYPYFGEAPHCPGCFFIEPFGGNGTVYSTIASQIIGDMIEFGSHPDAELFSYRGDRG